MVQEKNPWLKYFSSFVAVKLAKKSEGNHMLTNDCPHFFFANFTATKDEKYFRCTFRKYFDPFWSAKFTTWWKFMIFCFAQPVYITVHLLCSNKGYFKKSLLFKLNFLQKSPYVHYFINLIIWYSDQKSKSKLTQYKKLESNDWQFTH